MRIPDEKLLFRVRPRQSGLRGAGAGDAVGVGAPALGLSPSPRRRLRMKVGRLRAEAPRRERPSSVRPEAGTGPCAEQSRP